MDTMPAIDLPFDAPSAMKVLEWGASGDAAPCAHREIAAWCDRFWCHYLDADVPFEIARLLPILAEVDMEWDMRSSPRGAALGDAPDAGDDARLPTEWFEEWLARARTAP